MTPPTEEAPPRHRFRLRPGLWMLESGAVFAVLAISATGSGHPLTAWCAALGVTLSFLHAQGAASAAEASRESPPREASSVPFVRIYYVGRELAWAAYFLANIESSGWGMLAGCAAFLAYPAWRAWARRRPLAR